ncbi:LCP family protein [Frondihabitans peucedani]|uniref:LCP family protein n=1 Tax=Frondihabitans peucedani TaxID=598626 RepID=A0ABP8E3M3_9MICO
MSDTPRTRLRVRPRHVVRWIAIVVVLILVATIGYAVYNYQHFVSGVTHIDALPASTSQAKTSGENILLVGDDHRPANASAAELAELGTTSDGGGTNTDSMLILHIPDGGGKATLISLPRDSWVSIPGYGMGKLNAAFAYGSAKGGDSGGAKLLVETIQNLTTLHIDHFVRISMVGFYDVAKALGPLKVCLVDAVDDSYSTFTAPAGVSTLDAQQALAFVRQRHGLPNGDLDREARQRYFLSAEAKNFLKPSTLLNPGRLNAALTAVGSAIQTDKGLNWLTLATQLKDIAGGNLDSTTIPVSGTPTIYSGGTAISIVQVDTAKMPAFVAALDAAPASTSGKSTGSGSGAAASTVTPSQVSVTVLNGSGVAGAAGTSTATLATAGFTTSTPSTVSTRAASTIQYPSSMAAEARTLAAYVPGATLEAVTGVAGVTLVLGTDGATAKAKPSTAGSGSGSGSGSSGTSGSSGSSGSSRSGSSPAATKTAATDGITCVH